MISLKLFTNAHVDVFKTLDSTGRGILSISQIFYLPPILVAESQEQKSKMLHALYRASWRVGQSMNRDKTKVYGYILIVTKVSEYYSHHPSVPAATIVTQYQFERISKLKCELKEYTDTKYPKSVMSTIEVGDDGLFPNIKTLLQMLVTLPISGATSKRSFSTLRRVITWLRPNMLEKRLTDLAHIHPEIAPNIYNIIN